MLNGFLSVASEFKSLIDFELIFVEDEKWGVKFKPSVRGRPVSPAPFTEKAAISSRAHSMCVLVSAGITQL